MVIVLLTYCDAAVNLQLTVRQLLLTTFTVVFRSSAPPFWAQSTLSNMLLERVSLWLLAYKQISTS